MSLFMLLISNGETIASTETSDTNITFTALEASASYMNNYPDERNASVIFNKNTVKKIDYLFRSETLKPKVIKSKCVQVCSLIEFMHSPFLDPVLKFRFIYFSTRCSSKF